MVLNYFRTLGARLKEESAAKKLDCGTICGKQGAESLSSFGQIETNFRLSKPNATIVASHSGPDTGVAMYKHFAPDLPATWDNPADWAYGISVSMYDTGPTGRRNGEPVADCFGILAYPEGAVLAVADGVNWGEPPRRAARCAVLGCLSHMHAALKGHEADSDFDCAAVFRHMAASLGAAQRLILQQFGTLTTLVVSVVLPLKWVRQPGGWVALTLTVGDSAAYVYRAASGTVEEVTAAAHADGARDPRWCPGALGYALGEEPDLANLLACMTFMQEGDFIFLASDGVADNFDPVIRRMARHAMLDSGETDLPALSPAECQAAAMELLRGAIQEAEQAVAEGGGPGPVTHGSSSHGFPWPGGKGGGCGGGRLSARSLAEQLLQHVWGVTEEQRGVVEARARERERDRAAGGGGGGGGPSLGTDGKHGGLLGMSAAARPPGKMDHATVAAYQVGRRRARPLPRQPPTDPAAPPPPSALPFMVAQAASAAAAAAPCRTPTPAPAVMAAAAVAGAAAADGPGAAAAVAESVQGAAPGHGHGHGHGHGAPPGLPVVVEGAGAEDGSLSGSWGLVGRRASSRCELGDLGAGGGAGLGGCGGSSGGGSEGAAAGGAVPSRLSKRVLSCEPGTL